MQQAGSRLGKTPPREVGGPSHAGDGEHGRIVIERSASLKLEGNTALMLLLFNNAFRYFKMGYASALAWIIFIVILVLTLLQWAGQKKWVHYEGDAK